MLQQCDKVSTDPRERLLAFAQMPVQSEQQILQYGCPIGTLSSELVKDQDHGISKARLTAVFDLLRDWCEARFKELGYAEQARDYAMDLLAKMQGMSIIANVYNDGAFLHRTTNDIQQWIQQITSAQH